MAPVIFFIINNEYFDMNAFVIYIMEWDVNFPIFNMIILLNYINCRMNSRR